MLNFHDISRFYIPSGEVASIYIGDIPMWAGVKRYGFKREKANSDPVARITYLYDAEGMTPMSVDLSTGATNYGGWQEFIDELCRPVMLKTDGTVDYELNHNDQTLKLDGSASDITNTSYDGNAMVEFRKYKWVQRYEDETYEYTVFSNVQIDDTYHAYAHTNANGVVQDAFYWGMFKGTYSNSRLRSIGAGSLMVSQTRASEISRAQANGTGTDMTTNGYYITYKSGFDYIADILTLISKSDNSQNAFGRGRVKSTNKSALAAGTLKNKPAFYGDSTGTTDVKALYIEGIWGNIWDQLAGFGIDTSNGFKVKMTPPYDINGNGYYATGIFPSNSGGSFVKSTSCTDVAGYIPKTLDGSGSTYMCDRFTSPSSGYVQVIIGGGYTNEDECGSRCMYADTSAAQVQTWIGARLSYIKPTNI